MLHKIIFSYELAQDVTAKIMKLPFLTSVLASSPTLASRFKFRTMRNISVHLLARSLLKQLLQNKLYLGFKLINHSSNNTLEGQDKNKMTAPNISCFWNLSLLTWNLIGGLISAKSCWFSFPVPTGLRPRSRTVALRRRGKAGEWQRSPASISSSDSCTVLWSKIISDEL